MEHLRELVRGLKDPLGRPPRFHADDRRKRASKARVIGLKWLQAFARIVTLRTLSDRHQRRLGRKYSGRGAFSEVVTAAVLCYASGQIQIPAQQAKLPPTALARTDLRFGQAAPYSDAEGITKHFGFTVPMPEYSITNESFELRAPETLAANEAWGLLVWISPDDDPTTPGDWDSELSKQHLLLVSAHRCGNTRHPLDRFRLALDATSNMCRRYKVDRQRIYIGGFSGGARIASMLGVAYADVFTGTLCVCGANFYRDIPASGGQYYLATFTPNPGVLLQAKRGGRFVLVTGDHDENRDSMSRIATRGFKGEGFRHVLYLEAPGLGHEMPSAKALATALEYLADNHRDRH